MSRLAAIALWSACAACAKPKAYVMKLGGDEAAVATLCAPDPKDKSKESCSAYDGHAIAGNLAVVISGIDADATYSLEKEHEVIAAVGDPSAFFQLVFQRAFALTAETTAKLQGATLGKLPDAGGQVDAATGAVRDRLVGWLGSRGSVERGLADALAGKSSPPPQAAAALFDDYHDPATKKLVELTSADLGFGAPHGPLPPARAQAWEVSRELKWIDDSKNITEPGKQALAHLKQYCAPDSFGPDATEGLGQVITAGKTWREFLAGNRPEAGAVARALGFTDVAKLRDVLKGKRGLDLDSALGDALFSDHPTDDQRQLAFAQQAAQLHGYVATCAANVRLAAGHYPAVTELATLADKVDAFLTNVVGAAELFEKDLAPFLVTAVIDVVSGTVTGDKVTFGPFAIAAGETKLTVKRTDGSGQATTASLVVQGDRSVFGFGFGLGVGFAISMCDECTSTIGEKVDPGAAGSAATRKFTEERSSVTMEAMATGQVDLLSWSKISAGIVLGVPLTDVPGRENSLMIGLGVRLRDLVHVSVGLEAFTTRDLPGTDGASTEVVLLTDDDDQALTADQVSRLETRYAFVLAITFARDVL